VLVFVIVPIVVMNHVKETASRLGVIAGFIIVFWLFLELNLNVENKDVVTGTAAYAAIWVIYIGSVSGH